MPRKVSQSIHIALIIFGLAAFISYFLFPDYFIKGYTWLSLPLSLLKKLIPYIFWIAQKSAFPLLAQVFLEILYLIFILLFINLFINLIPELDNKTDRKYPLSYRGYFNCLEDFAYGKLTPSISLIDFHAKSEPSMIAAIDENCFQELGWVYFKKYVKSYFLPVVLLAFIIVPFLIPNIAPGINGLKGAMISVLLVYWQIRIIFEIVLIFFSRYQLKKSDED